MTDPKLITEAEVRTWMERGVRAIEGPVPVLTRLHATARAAAEADSLRAQLAVAVEERNSLRDDHAHSKHVQWLIVEHRNELEAATTDLRAQLAEARLDLSNCVDVGRRLEAALTTAQGEVARLTADLEEARKSLEVKRNKCPTHAGARVACGQCHDSRAQHLTTAQGEVARLKEENSRLWGEAGDASAVEARKQRDAAQGEVAVLREVVGRFLPSEGPYCGCPDERCMLRRDARDALASTRATAAAHDERVRREAIAWWINNTTTDEALRALLHPTKEKPE
jgi:DNA repair exonuclease SbcCD ATPase subunit